LLKKSLTEAWLKSHMDTDRDRDGGHKRTGQTKGQGLRRRRIET
jgi:hypothetical protein